METVPTNFPYLFAAYAVIWLVLFAYLFRLQRKERELRTQLQTLVADFAKEGATTAE